MVLEFFPDLKFWKATLRIICLFRLLSPSDGDHHHHQPQNECSPDAACDHPGVHIVLASTIPPQHHQVSPHHQFKSSLHWWHTGGLASSTRILISSWTNPSSISKLLPNSSLSSMPWWIQSYTGANKFCNKKNKENTKNSSLMSGSVRRSVLGCCARILRPTTPHQVTIMTIVKTRWYNCENQVIELWRFENNETLWSHKYDTDFFPPCKEGFWQVLTSGWLIIEEASSTYLIYEYLVKDIVILTTDSCVARINGRKMPTVLSWESPAIYSWRVSCLCAFTATAKTTLFEIWGVPFYGYPVLFVYQIAKKNL